MAQLKCCSGGLRTLGFHSADKFGTGFTLIRSDIGGNVDRLAAAYGKDNAKFRDIFAIVLEEVQRGEQEGKQSETNALLWLKR